MPWTKPYKKLLLLISVWQYGFQSVMGVEDSLKAIILCLKINSLKTQALVVKVCFANQHVNAVITIKINQKLINSIVLVILSWRYMENQTRMQSCYSGHLRPTAYYSQTPNYKYFLHKYCFLDNVALPNVSFPKKIVSFHFIFTASTLSFFGISLLLCAKDCTCKLVRVIYLTVCKCWVQPKTCLFCYCFELVHWCTYVLWLSIFWQMLAQACIQSEYYERVVEALQFYAKATRETKPFEMLVTLMYQQPITPQFQVYSSSIWHTDNFTWPAFVDIQACMSHVSENRWI